VNSARSGGGWASELTRLRFQYVSALLIAVVLPVTLRWGGEIDGWLVPVQFNTAVASSIAILIGMLSLRQIGALPGTREGYYLAPVMLASFAAVLLVMLFGRIEYNRYLFPSSLGLSVVWLFLLQSVTAKLRTPGFAIVPGGRAAELTAITGVTWMLIEKQALPAARINGVVADLAADFSDEWERFIADCALAGVRVFDFKQVHEALTGKVEIQHLSQNTLGSLNPDALYLKVKQAIDWVAALVALIALSPVLVAVGLWIRLDSSGPALFRQTRIGFRGRPFTVYKFRTMTADADGRDRESAMTKADDPRITRLGRWLRRSRIDELPQLLNILRGEMSWIGPRPEAEALSRWYEKELPFYRYRHIVRPGISGWAQINQGHVHAVDDVLEKLHYDFYYIKNFSPWLDALILLRTIRTMLTGFGAR
jgi:lipopolysaccharide/colanic/teichoic acid biosynthesis glycosyltransferase